MINVLLVLVGGGLGAITRYGVALLAVKLFGTRFPYGTLIVNLSGCFLIGVSFALAERGLNIMNPTVRLFFITGFLGGLTTFSSYAVETVNTMRVGSYLIAAANFLSNNFIGAILVFLGLWVGRVL
ncbi:MAG: fluoride efflux transporter CrcB [Syntrophobacteraceae bacterium]